MAKTLHYTLTDRHQYTYADHTEMTGVYDMSIDFNEEQALIREAASDLLSPRPEVINRILEMSRML